jgi:crotonobetainyl-CoA:carnitine CoA-transferase CaiB-like acyl-CoA transferase
VVEFPNDGTGAQVGYLFADFGAKVVLVEPPGGSGQRLQPSFPLRAPGTPRVVLELHWDGGVTSAVATLAAPTSSSEPSVRGVMGRLGLGYYEVARRKPRRRDRDLLGISSR